MCIHPYIFQQFSDMYLQTVSCEIGAYWKDLASMLHVPHYVRTVEQQGHKDPSQACYKLLQFWKKPYSPGQEKLLQQQLQQAVEKLKVANKVVY